MKEKFEIDFETSKLAWEKGFRVNTSKVYDSKGKKKRMSYGGCTITDFGGKLTSSPSLHTLQTWLRDKHQIYVIVDVDCTCEPKFCFYIHQFIGDPRDLSKEWDWKRPGYEFYLYRTYEEALEEGLKIALNMIG